MWSTIVKKNDIINVSNIDKKNNTEKRKKIIEEVPDINIFEEYHSSNCIDFIIDIKENLNKGGFKILDKDNINLTKNFIDFIQYNVICSEESKQKNEDNQEDVEFIEEHYFYN